MEFESHPFTDLLSKIVDNRGKTCPTADDGLPLIATNCVKNDRIYPSFDKVRYVDQNTVKSWFRGHPEPGDLIFVCKGTPGQVCLTPDPVSFCIAQDMVALRANPRKVYPLYLLALLRSEQIQAKIGNMHVGTLIPHFKKGDFSKLLLPVPDKATQRAIGDSYYEFSSKIELNRLMNATLEAMARTLFQSWFVDFDPVRRNAEGGESRPEDSLFPDSFEDSDLGEIPKGWRAGSLGDAIHIFDSKRVPLSGRQREQRKGQYPYHGAASVMDYVDDYLFEGIHLLLGEDGSVVNQDGTPVTQYVWGKFWVNNHAHVLQGKNSICTEHVLLQLKKTNIAAFVTGAVQPKLNQGNMNRIPMIIPPPTIGKAFAEAIDPLFSKIRSNSNESRTLAVLRDTLLPKLLSGELTELQPSA